MTRFIFAASLLVAVPVVLSAPVPTVRIDLAGTWLYTLPYTGEMRLELHRDGMYYEKFNRDGAPSIFGWWEFRDNKLLLKRGFVIETFYIHAKSTRTKLYASRQASTITEYKTQKGGWTRTDLVRQEE